jgi:hypothetical protein
MKWGGINKWKNKVSKLQSNPRSLPLLGQEKLENEALFH